ncbi:MAG: hypothetical protein K9L84_04645 [Candidatus Omnitrophica bacterium]|nr:hypothetical protein [Candidatus Omnitrophota bacterium]MCF7894331.1 hypothetical protein [Candidatus Omnitrophota bacterium]
MKIKKIFIIFVLFSTFFHILFFSQINLTLPNKQNPYINAWPNLLNKEDLVAKSQIAKLPKEVNFSTAKIRKAYFSKPLPESSYEYIFNQDLNNYLKPKNILKKYTKSNNHIFFLWEKEPQPTAKKKSISYRALVSPYGKIILLYPKKLVLDSHKNISSYNYLKESAYFLEKKFFWTKFDVLVK